jgi:anti-sigma regulatory factor (Ser/Thr protein kinase)
MSVQPLERFRHEALLYYGWAEFIGGTVPFIRGGLEAGEPVLVVESSEKIELLRTALDRDADQVLFADMAEVGANPARIIPAWHDFVARHGAAGKQLRGIGEPIWKGRTDDELIECQRHESLLNVAFGSGPAWWLLCPYDTEKLHPSVIEEAQRSHEFVSQAGSARASADFRGFEASGAPFDIPLPAPGSEAHKVVFGSEDLGSVRRVVREAAAEAGLDASRGEEFVMAANEVATNSLRHGGGGGTLLIWREPGRLLCEITDAGRYSQALADRTRPQSDPGAPRGLWLANQLCDLVQIRTMPSGTVVRLHVHLDPGPHLRLLPQTGSIESRPGTNPDQ